MKTILLLLSSDRFTFPLVTYLTREGKRYGWKLVVASMFDLGLFETLKKLEEETLSVVHIQEDKECNKEIRKADVVIAIIPDIMLLKVADACIERGKTLISPAKLTRQMFSRKIQAEESDALILLECGFTPGLDHLTAKKMIDHIHLKGGHISSFKTYTGNLVSSEDIDNPLQFKLTSPASEFLNFGKGNNRYLIHGALQHVPYHHLLARAEPITIHEMGEMMSIPEDDALYCRRLYELSESATVIKSRIVRKGFETFWNLIIRLGLTNGTNKVEMLADASFLNFLKSLVPYSATDSLETLLIRFMEATPEDIDKLKWLGLFDDTWFEGVQMVTPANILQFLMENKLSMLEGDRDCIIIRHDLEYSLNNNLYKLNATYVSHGDENGPSALATSIGLTVGSAARAVLLGNIKLKGIHTPVRKEIYDPVLHELEDLGIAFHVEEKTLHAEDVSQNR